MTQKTVTDYETVETEENVIVCDLCAEDVDDDDEAVPVTDEFHICIDCILEYSDAPPKYRLEDTSGSTPPLVELHARSLYNDLMLYGFILSLAGIVFILLYMLLPT